MKKIERVCAITHILTENPNRDFSLGYFAELFGCAKSSISEDIKLIRETMDDGSLGTLETTAGTKGGVRYVPAISQEETEKILLGLKKAFEEDDRMLGSGLLYTSDILFNPDYMKGAARIFARQFARSGADMVVTVETKGIGVALFTAELLHLPLAVLRRESRVSEGSIVSVNYMSGSSARIQQMSLSKRALKPHTKALIIDDIMRAGGSIKGIEDMLAEFDAQCCGIGAVIVAGGIEGKKIGDYVPLLLMNETENNKVTMDINPLLLAKQQRP
ncbi:MAG: pur operon repressor [Firmicutes bacterium]|nr:pur operon repressor [Bacillota bacterium]